MSPTSITPQHSPLPYPSADASRVLHRPSGDDMRAAAMLAYEFVLTEILTPAAML
jgi:hypothetical protein